MISRDECTEYGDIPCDDHDFTDLTSDDTRED